MQDALRFLRMRTGQYEMMITPGKPVCMPFRSMLQLTICFAEEKYTLVVFHDPNST